MSKTINTEYAIGEKVRILGVNEVGCVYSINVSKDGLEYSVKWFSNCDRKQDWFRGEELTQA